MGERGPRVTCFPERASRDGPCLVVTIGAALYVIVQGLPAGQASGAALAIRGWVPAKEAALHRFWRDGVTWTRGEANASFDGLTKSDPG